MLHDTDMAEAGDTPAEGPAEAEDDVEEGEEEGEATPSENMDVT